LLNSKEIEDQDQMLLKHDRKASALARKYGLKLSDSLKSVRFDPKWISRKEVADILSLSQDDTKRTFSLMRKQFLVIHACRVSKDAAKWIHETESGEGKRGGYTKEMREKRARAWARNSRPQ
jgi:hypothetical protein